jgi:hypothetical protein
VVLHEGSKKSRVRAVGFHGVDAVHEVADAPTGRLESLCHPKVLRIVQDTAHVLLRIMVRCRFNFMEAPSVLCMKDINSPGKGKHK